MNEYYAQKEYHKVRFTSEALSKSDFDTCRFVHCDFSDLAIHSSEFLECEFEDCNWSNTKVRGVSFKEVTFTACKVLGVKFSEADPFLFKADFENCQLNYSSFYRVAMAGFEFKNCELVAVDFTGANLTASTFENCLLNQAVFEESKLEKVNFVTAQGLSLDLDKNRVKGALFSKDQLEGVLRKYQIIVE